MLCWSRQLYCFLSLCKCHIHYEQNKQNKKHFHSETSFDPLIHSVHTHRYNFHSFTSTLVTEEGNTSTVTVCLNAEPAFCTRLSGTDGVTRRAVISAAV